MFINKFAKKYLFLSSSSSLLLFNHRQQIVYINEIAEKSFDCIKYYVFRLEYSSDQYEQHQCRWNEFHSYYRTIWMTICSWISIGFMMAIVYWSLNDNSVAMIMDFEKQFQIQKSVFLIINLVIIFIILEHTWYVLFQKILNYNFKSQKLLIKYSMNDDDDDQQRLSPQYHQQYSTFVHFLNFVAKWFTIIMIMLNFQVFILISYQCFCYYSNGEMNLTYLSIFHLLSLISLWRSNYMIGQLFGAMKYLLFIIEFFKFSFQQIIFDISSLFPIVYIEQWPSYCYKRSTLFLYYHNNHRSHYYYLNLNWKKFSENYVKCFTETSILNETLSSIFLDIEFISKSAFICGTLFYSQQIHMNLYSVLAILLFLSPFCYSNALYMRVAKFPSYNQFGYHYLFNWLARLQWFDNNNNNNNNRLKLQTRRRYNHRLWIRNQIKSNLFIQTISSMNHRFGFTCGQAFFITKFKFIEIFLMNFVLILLFYKKICLHDVN
ncbi:hypothetical protein HUG17_6747 [Dermatophagoides farinae]|uniref:Uncharacterized protein n=1 Tax=Dermatophagoides farinae TaxID=6954 RepID=A0A9D4P447_DERFA|nr:hypothetical protein HUG17_6747 [Dermatophagoides farinae]